MADENNQAVDQNDARITQPAETAQAEPAAQADAAREGGLEF